MLSDFTRTYLVDGLRAAPEVLGHLMAQVSPSRWDHRPDPERFTLREVFAHLADWDTVWRERLDLLLTEGNALLPDRDPDQLARDHDYANADPAESLRVFQSRRAKLVEKLAALASDDWRRQGEHQARGRFTVEDLAVTALGHDSYHLAQVSERSRAVGHQSRERSA